MKRIILLSSVLLAISCSSDDGESQTSNSSILGKWKITNYEEQGQELEECEWLETKEYLSTGKIKDTYFYGNNCSTQGMNDNTLFTIEGDRLLTREPNGGMNPSKDYKVKYIIRSLNESTMVLEGYFVDEGVDGITPTEIPVAERFTETWQKVN